MKQLIALLCAIFLVACATSAFTPKEFASRLQQQGSVQTLKHVSSTEWLTLLVGVSKGDKAWLDLVPQFAESIYYLKDQSKNAELTMALIFALVNNPAETLTMMQIIDRRIAAMGDHGKPLVNFGSTMFCTATLTLDYDRDSNWRYYRTLSERLKKIGKLGEECLKSLNEAMADIEFAEKQDDMTWPGTSVWYP